MLKPFGKIQMVLTFGRSCVIIFVNEKYERTRSNMQKIIFLGTCSGTEPLIGEGVDLLIMETGHHKVSNV